MHRLIKRALERANHENIYIAKATKKERILNLLKKLRPISTNVSLIRIGSERDGGYLVPDDMNGISACISPGVACECGFDLDVANRGIDVYMADASVDGPPISHPKFHFLKKFVDSYSDNNTMTINDLVRLLPSNLANNDLLLQMDIEGAEYRVLHNLDEDVLKKFRIIVIEFHHLGTLFSRMWFEHVSPIFLKLLSTHSVVHIHPNNNCRVVKRRGVEIPDVMEFTFYRNDRFSKDNEALIFPHHLDTDNIAGIRPIPLPDCWK